MSLVDPRDTLGISDSENESNIRCNDIISINEAIRNSISKREAAEILVNLFEANNKISSTIDRDFLSQINMDYGIIKKVNKTVEDGFFVSQAEINVPISPKVKIISDLRIVPDSIMAADKMETSSIPRGLDDGKVYHYS